MPDSEKIDGIVAEVQTELNRAMFLHAPQRSAHESYAVILEELEEFLDEVKKKRSERDKRLMRLELVQTAAMCIRAIHDLEL